MESNQATVTTAPPTAKHAPVTETEVSAAVQAAFQEIDWFESPDRFVSLPIRQAVEALASNLKKATALPQGAQSYRAQELLDAVSGLRTVSSRVANGTSAELKAAKQDLRILSEIPRAMDAVDAIVDGEVRALVRGMTSSERKKLLDEIKEGSHQRVALALARSPIVGDVETAAATAYAATSEPVRRGIALSKIQIAEAVLAAAKQLDRAIDATRAAVELGGRARAHRIEVQQSTGPRPVVQYVDGDGSRPAAGTPAKYERPEVSSIGGPSIVRS